MLISLGVVAFSLSLGMCLFMRWHLSSPQTVSLSLLYFMGLSSVRKDLWKCPSVSVSHCSLPNPPGALPRASLSSPTGRWLCGGTRGPPAGHSTPVTARATATRPTECQTESGEKEGEEGTERDFEFRCHSHQLLTHSRVSEQTVEQHGKVNSGRLL